MNNQYNPQQNDQQSESLEIPMDQIDQFDGIPREKRKETNLGDIKISSYANKQDTEGEDTCLRDMIQKTINPIVPFKNQILEARKLLDKNAKDEKGVSEYKKKKDKLAGTTPMGTFYERNDDGIKNASYIIELDYDNSVPSNELSKKLSHERAVMLDQAKQTLLENELYSTAYIKISPSANGLKHGLYVNLKDVDPDLKEDLDDETRRKKEKNAIKKIAGALIAYTKVTYGGANSKIKVDSAASNCSRLSFDTYDPNAYYNFDIKEASKVDEILEKYAKANKQMGENIEQIRKGYVKLDDEGNTASDVLEEIKRVIDRAYALKIDLSYHEPMWFKISVAILMLFASKEEAHEYFIKMSCHHDDFYDCSPSPNEKFEIWWERVETGAFSGEPATPSTFFMRALEVQKAINEKLEDKDKITLVDTKSGFDKLAEQLENAMKQANNKVAKDVYDVDLEEENENVIFHTDPDANIKQIAKEESLKDKFKGDKTQENREEERKMRENLKPLEDWLLNDSGIENYMSPFVKSVVDLLCPEEGMTMEKLAVAEAVISAISSLSPHVRVEIPEVEGKYARNAEKLPVNLYTLLQAPAGTGKGKPLSAAESLLTRVDRICNMNKDAKVDNNNFGIFILGGSFTKAALVLMIKSNGGMGIVLTTEISEYANEVKNEKKDDASSAMNQMLSGETVRDSKVHNGTILIVEGAHVSVLMSGTKEIAGPVYRTGKDNGFLSRLDPILYSPREPEDLEQPVETESFDDLVAFGGSSDIHNVSSEDYTVDKKEKEMNKFSKLLVEFFYKMNNVPSAEDVREMRRVKQEKKKQKNKKDKGEEEDKMNARTVYSEEDEMNLDVEVPIDNWMDGNVEYITMALTKDQAEHLRELTHATKGRLHIRDNYNQWRGENFHQLYTRLAMKAAKRAANMQTSWAIKNEGVSDPSQVFETLNIDGSTKYIIGDSSFKYALIVAIYSYGAATEIYDSCSENASGYNGKTKTPKNNKGGPDKTGRPQNKETQKMIDVLKELYPEGGFQRKDVTAALEDHELDIKKGTVDSALSRNPELEKSGKLYYWANGKAEEPAPETQEA